MLKNKKFFFIFLVILIVGFFLRAFKFNDWMHYQLDQARDFRIVHSAMKWGIGELPLQGPKASGNVEIKSESGEYDDTTTLRLGPLFYYINYLSTLIFGDTPAGSLILLLFLSFLTIPLFYIFSREFFGQKISLILSTIFSVSLFFITYSRFGWNPNLMPFFMLLTIFSVLQVVKKSSGKVAVFEDFYFVFVKKEILNQVQDDKEKYQNFYKFSKGWWLILASISLAFLTNMHFLAFVIAPAIIAIFFFFSFLFHLKIVKNLNFSKKDGIFKFIFSELFNFFPPFRFWLFAILILVFLNIPLIINDFKTGGENYKAFISTLTKKSAKNQHTLLEKLVVNIGEHNRYFWLILTGDQNAEIPQFISRENAVSKSKKTITCYGDLFCRSNVGRKEFFRGILSLILLLASLFSFSFFYFREKNEEKRNFLNLIGIWLLLNFILYIPLSYDLAPRFFLLSGPLALILFGMILKFVSEISFLKIENYSDTEKNKINRVSTRWQNIKNYFLGIRITNYIFQKWQKMANFLFAIISNLKVKKFLLVFVWTISFIFIIFNLYFVSQYFYELSQAGKNPNLTIKTDYILKEKNRMTLQQMEEIVDFLEQKNKENNFPIFLDGQSEFKRAFWERLDFRKIPRDQIPRDLKPLYQEGNYFVILRTQSDNSDYLKKFLVGMDLVETKIFGTLSVYQLKPKVEFITDEKKIISPADERTDPEFSSSAQVRYLWRQVFEK